MGNFLVWVVWLLAAFGCLASAVGVVTVRNPFFSTLALIGNLGSLAVLYLLVSAEFVAAAQVLVYAGAIVVMFLFVLRNVGPDLEAPWGSGPTLQNAAAVVAAAALFVEIIVVIALKAGGDLSHTGSVNATFGSPGWIGQLFLTNHLLAFEITSIVLLIAAVGGVILGSHTRRAV